ncbi:putative disease resistance RPP13-like protein 1 [Humulus lupulus]|uniref:putative disease resistance RPP13-like protein 1 n=1 Tax=Humulus lupulus TaxID=3486 RepID=UPI002B416A87|nr:putative disease resistance RPP13-like protein 1 [Humulus lupulus]
MALVAGEACLSAFLDMLIKELASDTVRTFYEGKVKEPIAQRLTDLETALKPANNPGLNVAEKEQIRDERMKKWLDEFKEAVYDADDLVYKINTVALQKDEGKSPSSIKSKVMKKLAPTPFTAFDSAIVAEIDEIIGSLEKPLPGPVRVTSDDNRRTRNYLGLEKVGTNLPERSLAHVEESDIYGMVDIKDAICKLLLSDVDKLSVIAIEGKSGIGKTTLAYVVYNDKRVNTRFLTKAWVIMDKNKIDAATVMKAIIEKVTSEKCQYEKRYELQNKLKKVLSMKKFLLVIDGFPKGNDDAWRILKSCFESGRHGSKIIVTTCEKDVIFLTMKTSTTKVYSLKGISSDDGWSLFEKYSSVKVDAAPNLQDIGREIVSKCGDHPLAIKLLAHLLCGNQNENEWGSIRNSTIWEMSESSRIGIHPALWLSYYYLPSHLKLCFAYFALFPKGFKFEKQKIILLWMAEGLLPSTEEKRMEDFGDDYFEYLMARSFLQPTSEDRSAFVMHDLLHELSSFVCGEFCFSMDDPNLFDCPRKIRHLSYSKGCHDDWTSAGFSNIKGLRTLLAFPISNYYVTPSYNKRFLMPVEYLIRILSSSGTCLRVLSLSEHYITKLPDSIGDLKYLKYLDLSFTEIEVLPDTVFNLYNLQTLLLEGCTRLTALPMRIGCLNKLRHLHTPPYLQEMPLQLGEITTLQTLSEFVVGKNDESGVKLLRILQGLHGTLHISGLENGQVKDVKKGELLEDKKFVGELILKWGFGHAANDEVSQKKEKEVLDALIPHAELRQLSIFHYKGTSFPGWVGDKVFTTLRKVDLNGCKKCSSLPPLGQLPSLEHLVIQGFHSLKTINPEFYSGEEPFKCLKTLIMTDMAKLKEGLFTKGMVEGEVFPQLEEIELRDCPKLKVSIPDNLRRLKKLVIYKCNQVLPLMDAVPAFPFLVAMIMFDCEGQVSFLGGLPSSSKEIFISGYGCFKVLDEVAFRSLTSLERGEISFYTSLECLPKILPSSSLSFLCINNCPLLTPRLHVETGPDWLEIAHIRTVDTQMSSLQLSDASSTPDGTTLESDSCFFL